MNEIFIRRSVRKFNTKRVEEEKINEILRAGMQAPSAKNQQPWEFIVVRGEKNLEELSKYNVYATCLKGANVAIIVLCNTEKLIMPEFWQQDLSAVTQNIELQAVTLGLGSVWMGTAPEEKKMNYIKEMFSLKDNLLPFSVIALGYPLYENANKFKDRFDESRITYIND